jgi:acyl-CoA dehydrogenase
VTGSSADSLAAPYLAAEHDEFRRYVRSALAVLVTPQADKWEREGQIPRVSWQKLGDLGLLGIGHTGSDFLRSAIFLEELGRTGYAGVRAAVAVHAYMASSYLELFGTARQKERYLGPAREGSLIAGLAISEPTAGSDLRHIATTANRHRDGGYSVSGEKAYVTNGSSADLLVVLASTSQSSARKVLTGASMLLVDAHSSGIYRYPQPMLGWRSADISRVQFADVRVPEDCVLGRADQALVYMMKALDFERLVAGFLALGGVGCCLDLLHKFVAQRHVRDRPLSANTMVRHEIAELDSEYLIMRHYAYHVAWLQSTGRLDTRSASVLKLKSTELAVAASRKCLQYQGAQGYLAQSAAARIYCDAAGGTIAGGPSEVMREMIFELE